MSTTRKYRRSIAKANRIPLLVTSRRGRYKIKKYQESQAAIAAEAKQAADRAIAADPALANLSDEELAARNLAAAK